MRASAKCSGLYMYIYMGGVTLQFATQLQQSVAFAVGKHHRIQIDYSSANVIEVFK